MIVNEARVRSFATAAAFEKWLAKHHASEPELWIKIHKKASGLPSITAAEAIDVCLCWGWIDGLRKGFDDRSFLQRYTPRTAKSIWSRINQEHVARLVAAGKMTKHGHAQVDLAKGDGRWARAYGPMREASAATVPADLRKAIAAKPKAAATFRTLDKLNLFAITFRLNAMKTPAGRAKKIEAMVATLERGEPIVKRPLTRKR
jgi:uncharacterized protein YdeI (YjbR/CyaY-like superfamily)